MGKKDKSPEALLTQQKRLLIKVQRALEKARLHHRKLSAACDVLQAEDPRSPDLSSLKHRKCRAKTRALTGERIAADLAQLIAETESRPEKSNAATDEGWGGAPSFSAWSPPKKSGDAADTTIRKGHFEDRWLDEAAA